MLETGLNAYRAIVGSAPIDQLFQVASCLKNKKIVHINSTREGGGVAEILSKMTPLTQALGMDVRWEVIDGGSTFFECTKLFHNLLQGLETSYPSDALLKAYEETNAKQAERLKGVLQEADIVFIHDPQPLPLLSHIPERKGKWVWRCHIDLSAPAKPVWDYLKKFIGNYDASIFSLESFAKSLPHPIFIIPPSIDPISDKNVELAPEEVLKVFNHFGIDPERPVLLQVSRFDHFKDPLGVIAAYRIAKKNYPDLQLVLVGSGATDDPEGAKMFEQVEKAGKDDPDIFVLLLPPTSHRVINSLQRGSTIVLQKSLKEGFGLTVAEALWKKKPVIGGNAGGIRLQVIDGQTGLLVSDAKEAASRINFLMQNAEVAQELGNRGKQHVLQNFLITRHLREYLTVMAQLLLPDNSTLREIPSVKSFQR